MYLHVNIHGFRHVITDTFKGVLELISKDGNYVFSILDVDRPGKYNLIVVRETEKISKKTYVKAKIVLNPDNNYINGSLAYVLKYFSQDITVNNNNNEKSFNVISLFSEKIVLNGYIALDADIHETILDNFEELTEMLDKFFEQ